LVCHLSVLEERKVFTIAGTTRVQLVMARVIMYLDAGSRKEESHPLG
jgi:hypothetical protein